MNDLNYYGYEFIREADLTHHGIKGQKWGQRRFQNEDGTWTAAGKERYGDDGDSGANKQKLSYAKNDVRAAKNAYRQAKKDFRNSPEQKAKRAANAKKALKIGAAVVGTALVAYGAYKINSNIQANKREQQRAAEFARKMKQGKETFKALEKDLFEQSKRDDFRGGQVAVTLPDGTVLKTVFGSRK